MTTTPTRFQFSLRKLMLWMVVVALYCGVFVLVDSVSKWYLACMGLWTLPLLGLRVWFRPSTVCCLSAIGMGSVLVFLEVAAPSGTGLSLEMFVFGCACGWFVFSLAELALRVVNWADDLVRGKTDE